MQNSDKQLETIKNSTGFIAALDQSGGSTPKALKMYGINEDEYSGEDEMYAKVHQMRSRIMTDVNFAAPNIVGAILFENTMDRAVDALPTSQYLWEQKGIVPILKIDKGLADEHQGIQLMKPMPELDSLLDKALANGIFGTKMRSVIKSARPEGIREVVAQQFAIGKQIIAKGLVPIIEPEVDIHAPDKAEAEDILKQELLHHLDTLSAGEWVIFKLTLPEHANHYADCQAHSNVLKVVALSGGYSRKEATKRLSENHNMIASFSRALSEGLSAQQTNEEFSATLKSSIDAIVTASAT